MAIHICDISTLCILRSASSTASFKTNSDTRGSRSTMRFALVSVLLLAVLCAASAGRVAPDEMFSTMKDTWNNAGNMQAWHALTKGKEDKPAYVAFKYLVEPQKHKAFTDAWGKLEGKTKDEKGLDIFDLKKPVTNNYMWVGYGEWKTARDYMDHFESDYVQEFLDTLRDNDIEWTIVPLLRPKVAELHKENGGKTSKQQAHVIIRYTVPPSQQQKFLDAWNQAEKGTEGEKGAHIYSLRKVLADNVHYIAYGTWETRRDFYEHFESDHIRELRKSLDGHGITWELAPLYKVGDQPE